MLVDMVIAASVLALPLGGLIYFAWFCGQDISRGNEISVLFKIMFTTVLCSAAIAVVAFLLGARLPGSVGH